MRQYMYVSTSVGLPNIDTIYDILVGTRYFNKTHGLTGFLLYEDGTFMQILEGASEDITAVLDRIHADPRHKDITELFNIEVANREFLAWSMGCAAMVDLPKELREDYHKLITNPQSLGGALEEGNATIGLQIMRAATRVEIYRNRKTYLR